MNAKGTTITPDRIHELMNPPEDRPVWSPDAKLEGPFMIPVPEGTLYPIPAQFVDLLHANACCALAMVAKGGPTTIAGRNAAYNCSLVMNELGKFLHQRSFKEFCWRMVMFAAGIGFGFALKGWLS
jgi:hypothetical protein